MKRNTLLTATLLSLSLLAGCSSTSTSETAAETKAATETKAAAETTTATETTNTSTADTHLNVTPYRWVDGIDPTQDWNGVNASRFLLCETLVTLTDGLEIVGVLAEEFEQIDETTYEFKIRDNVTFTNGNPLTAEAVKASLERTMEVNARGGDAKIDTMTIDGNTLTITTTEPYAAFYNALTDSMYSIIDVTDMDEVNTKPVATGAYYVTEHVPEERFELAANENYWGGVPNIKTITVKNIAHDRKADAILSGDLDVAQGPTMTTVARMEGNTVGAEILTLSGVREYDLILNCREGHPLSDLALREAISYAINRDVVAQVIGNGYAKPLNMSFPESANYGFDKLVGQSYDLEMSKSILSENGYTDSDGDGYIELADGGVMEFNLLVDTSLFGTAMPEAIQHMLKEIGIKINIEATENFSYNPADHLDTDMTIDGAFPVNNGDGQKFLEAGFSTNGTDNYGGYSNPEFDEIMIRLGSTFDSESRMEIFIEAQQHIVDQVANVWMYAPDDVTLVSSKVKGVTIHPLNTYLVTLDWEIQE